MEQPIKTAKFTWIRHKTKNGLSDETNSLWNTDLCTLKTPRQRKTPVTTKICDGSTTVRVGLSSWVRRFCGSWLSYETASRIMSWYNCSLETRQNRNYSHKMKIATHFPWLLRTCDKICLQWLPQVSSTNVHERILSSWKTNNLWGVSRESYLHG